MSPSKSLDCGNIFCDIRRRKWKWNYSRKEKEKYDRSPSKSFDCGKTDPTSSKVEAIDHLGVKRIDHLDIIFIKNFAHQDHVKNIDCHEIKSIFQKGPTLGDHIFNYLIKIIIDTIFTAVIQIAELAEPMPAIWTTVAE